MEVGLFVLGVLVGIGLCAYVLERQHAIVDLERETNFQSRLTALHNELKDSDAVLAETRDRLIALQLGQPAGSGGSRADTGLLEAEIARLRGELAAATAVAAQGADDLTRIKGIGRVIERRLHELGITSFRQLAELSPTEVRRINEALEFPGRVERERWIEQARSLSEAA